MSTSELTSIIDQLDQAFDKDPWYGDCINNILESVEPERVFDPPAPGVHSIAELIMHMLTWREFAVKRLAGDNDYLPGQEESFNWKSRFPEKANAWKLLKEKLSAGHQKLLALLLQNDDTLLEQPVAGKPYNFRYLLNGIIQHDLYHAGQISFINKMQKTRKNNSISTNGRTDYRVFSYENMSLLK